MPTEELGYWTGVVQTDGSLKHYFEKKRRVEQVRISFTVSKSSIPMVEKFLTISTQIFNRHGKLNKEKNREVWYTNLQVKKLLPIFEVLNIKFGDPPRPPEWVQNNESLFGSYLSGVVDGDGSINWTDKGARLRVKIISGNRQTELQELLNRFGIRSWIFERNKTTFILERKIVGKTFELEFEITQRKLEFYNKYVVPYLQVIHKKQKVVQFIKEKGPNRESNPGHKLHRPVLCL